MNTTINGILLPTVNLAINKSRVKSYISEGEKLPCYYLKHGTEFQIELFNPTQKTVLAKIKLDNQQITQGGLVLKPGQRVFLERYIDVAKKFLFETYEVGASNEVKKAIEKNGDLIVEFFNEVIPVSYNPLILLGNNYQNLGGSFGNDNYYYSNNLTNISNSGYAKGSSANDVTMDSFYFSTNANASAGEPFTTSNLSLTSFNAGNENAINSSKGVLRGIAKKTKSIETGRVEQGSASNQKLTTVNKDFEYYSFHKISYKILPISQKVNESKDIQIKSYCTECGVKQKIGFKFCPKCGTKN